MACITKPDKYGVARVKLRLMDTLEPSAKLNAANAAESGAAIRPPIAILGVPFDNVTVSEALVLIEKMVASRRPHYLVTANVDFLVQARSDVELRRILFDANLVLCDGTPLVWASRALGNALPERVAGADVVPLLVRVAAEKGHRVFFLGAAPESISRAVARLQQKHPALQIAGYYSPPFNKLLEMDHDEIVRRIKEARPDMLFVSFGCPKQEKWIAMHYRSLGVPVTVGVGATIDFLAGQVKRAPAWMQRTGTEWVFRMVQEPRRLVRRYLKDLWVFSWNILPQLWHLRLWRRAGGAAQELPVKAVPGGNGASAVDSKPAAILDHAWLLVRPPARLDHAAICQDSQFVDAIVADGRDCLLQTDRVDFVDSTGVGMLIRLQKKLRASGRYLVLLAPSKAVKRALRLMQLQDFFDSADDLSSAEVLLETRRLEISITPSSASIVAGPFLWQGEITAANADQVWTRTVDHLSALSDSTVWTIDLSRVRFIDSSGLGLMVRARKLAHQRQRSLAFTGLQPPVRNVLRIAQLEEYLLRNCA